MSWQVASNPVVAELRAALALAPPEREHRVHGVAGRLGLRTWHRSSSGWPFRPRDRLNFVTLGRARGTARRRLEGDGAIEVTRVAGIEQAGPGEVTFLANPKYTAALASTRAAAVILDPASPAAPCAVLRTDNPYLAFARAAQALRPAPAPCRPASISRPWSPPTR